MEPRTDSSASRLCGGTRSGRSRRTSSAVRTTIAPPSHPRPVQTGGNASPRRPPGSRGNSWGNTDRWSCLKIPCHCGVHLRFPMRKTLWKVVYRSPLTLESQARNSSGQVLPRRGGLRSGSRSGSSTPPSPTTSSYGHHHSRGLRSTTPAATHSPSTVAAKAATFGTSTYRGGSFGTEYGHDAHELTPGPTEDVGKVTGRLANAALFGLVGYLLGWAGALMVAVFVAGVSPCSGVFWSPMAEADLRQVG